MGALRKLRARPGALGGVLRRRAPVLHLFIVRRRLGYTDVLQRLRGKLRILVSGPEPMPLCHFAPLPPPRVSSELARPLPGRTGAPRNTGQAFCGSPCGRDSRVSASSYAHTGARPSGSRCRDFFFPGCCPSNLRGVLRGARDMRSSAPLAVKGPATGESGSPSPTPGGKLEATRRRPTLARVRWERT